MKLSNKRVVERANCGDKKAVAVAKLRRIGNYETKAYKFVDVNNIDVDKLKRIHLKSKERLICSEQIENVIKKIKKSDGLLKELKKHDIDVTFDYHATVGDSYYNNKTHNEILTDSISLLYNQNGLYILCDKKTKSIAINRRTQERTHFCNLQTENNTDVEFSDISDVRALKKFINRNLDYIF